MDGRKVFTLDPERFPLERMRELVAYLHDHDQHYIVMVDPAVAYQDYGPFNRGVDDGVFLKTADGSIYRGMSWNMGWRLGLTRSGVTWPGVTAFPDWFHPNTQSYWNNEFDIFFNADTGLDIDGLWIDMNEACHLSLQVFFKTNTASRLRTFVFGHVPTHTNKQ
jgi:alpha-glucosidase